MSWRPSICLEPGLPDDYIPEYPWFERATLELRARMRANAHCRASPRELRIVAPPAFHGPITEREAFLALVQAVVLLEESADAWPLESESEYHSAGYLLRACKAMERIEQRAECGVRKPQLRLIK